MKSIEEFTPLFKENEKEQYYFRDGEWHLTSENHIHSLWSSWVVSPMASTDGDGEFSIFGYRK